MKQFVYPAVLYRFDEDESQYTVSFPDINIYCDGDSVEVAYVKAKNFLYAYCLCSLRLGNKFEKPTSYLKTIEKYPDKIVLLVDCLIKEEDVNNDDNFFDTSDMFDD